MPKAINSLDDGTHYQVDIKRTITYGKQQIAVADDVYMTGKMIKELNAMPEFEGAIGDVEDLPQGVVI